MIVTKQFVFLHLPRCGGTFITGVIKKFFPTAHEIGHHLPRELMPKEYSHLPVLCTIRNPWEFYVSLYHYVWPRDGASILVSWMTENGAAGFAGSTRNLLSIGSDEARLDRLLEMLPEEIDYTKRHVPSLTRSVMRRVRGTGLGYYSFRFKQMFGDVNDVFFCRLEKLGPDLVNFFERIGVQNRELQDYVLEAEKVNSTKHLHYSTYYTAELADLVSIHDHPVIKRFGYSFERIESSPSAPTVEPFDL
jgi:hypothetical protein